MELRSRLLAAYCVLILVFSFIGDEWLPEERLTHWTALLRDKRNFANQIFVKWGWFWTTIPILFLSYKSAIANVRALLWASAYWYVWTQWCFGPSLFDRLFHLYPWAYCTETAHTSFHECRSGGHRWISFDSSGHCFLLVHSSLLLWETLLDMYMAPRPRKPFWFRATTVYILLLLGLWSVMLISTCMFYHTWSEKLAGLAVSCVFHYWWIG